MTNETQLSNQYYRETTNDANALKVRLSDIKEVHSKIHSFLSGKTTNYVKNERGELVEKIVKFGDAKLNDVGIQSIMALITMAVNTQTVQGNMPSDKWGVSKMYNDFIYRFQINLGNLLTINMWDWDVKDEDYFFIIDGIMNLVELFVSRLIDNKERESYSTSLKSSESNAVRDNGFKLFG